MTFGEQIKQAREKQNLSQEDLAARLGVSRQAASKWENGSAKPQSINREMLLQVLEMEIHNEETASVTNDNAKRRSLPGWIIAVIISVIVVIGIGITRNVDKQIEPAIKSITFYDSDQNEVTQEALWYNSARIESILIQWEGGTPDNINFKPMYISN